MEETVVPVFTIVWLILVPVPLLPLPLQLTVLVPIQGVRVILNASPEQIVVGLGEAVTSGVSLIPITSGRSPVRIFPHASVTVGGGTERTEIVSQVHGQAGIVKFNSLGVVAAEHPEAVPAVTLPLIQGWVIVKGGTP